MNQRNVHALALLMAKHDRKGIGSHYIAELAKKLAAEGVLVPSALTDEEGRRIASIEYESECTWGSVEALRAELERIAKGEDQ